MPENFNKDVRYYAVDDLKKVVATTQRTGSNSMAEALGPADDTKMTRFITLGEAFELKQAGWPVLLWIRYPFDRIASAYHIFGRDRDVSECMEMFMSELNPHWSSVVKLHTRGTEFMPTTVHAFEDIDATWANELPSYELPHIGEQNRRSWFELVREISDNQLHRMMEHWRNDLDVHKWALRESPLGFKVAA
jgi:hypothetical protein